MVAITTSLGITAYPGRNGVTLLIWESTGKALSSDGIRPKKKTHINCGSSARMTDIKGANEDQIRHQGPGNNTTTKDIFHQPSKKNDSINGMLPHQWSIILPCSCRP
ncbi:hypothetical protein [Absidia glauca]|uniref:Ndc10 domain-containing protein n=1 Tax=Absidia glauca TaxID=4829 RepID=A0A163K1R6_ABSGL|nr:hypothetical protein [Absidia glauca]